MAPTDDDEVIQSDLDDYGIQDKLDYYGDEDLESNSARDRGFRKNQGSLSGRSGDSQGDKESQLVSSPSNPQATGQEQYPTDGDSDIKPVSTDDDRYRNLDRARARKPQDRFESDDYEKSSDNENPPPRGGPAYSHQRHSALSDQSAQDPRQVPRGYAPS